MSEEKKVTMRDPFPDNQVGKLPKPTKRQADEVRQDYKKGIRCELCKQWHHPDVVHLDYVGHAPLTDRMLDVDLNWNWEPVAFDDKGLPAFDETGGLWIRLTINGITRLGYGNAAKSGYSDVGSREKECIGDALRNAGMRFGAALDLWHKGVLHAEAPDEEAIADAQETVDAIKPEVVNKEMEPQQYYNTVDQDEVGIKTALRSGKSADEVIKGIQDNRHLLTTQATIQKINQYADEVKDESVGNRTIDLVKSLEEKNVGGSSES